jgi:molecular chaperone DnaJ
MENRTHYERLEVSTSASTEQIKAAYRRLARQHHPDLNNGTDAEIMKQLNEAYAVLTEVKRRESYDQTLEDIPRPYHVPKNQIKPRGSREDEAQVLWLQRIYHPVSRSIRRIVDSFESRLEDLSYDPYDDELVEAFAEYLETSQRSCDLAWTTFRSKPNPATLALAAEYLYHSLNQLKDGLDELGYFVQNYGVNHLHTGQDLLTICAELLYKAEEAMANSGLVQRR